MGHLICFYGQLSAKIAVVEMELHTVSAVGVGPRGAETSVWAVANHDQRVLDRRVVRLFDVSPEDIPMVDGVFGMGIMCYPKPTQHNDHPCPRSHGVCPFFLTECELHVPSTYGMRN